MVPGRAGQDGNPGVPRARSGKVRASLSYLNLERHVFTLLTISAAEKGFSM